MHLAILLNLFQHPQQADLAVYYHREPGNQVILPIINEEFFDTWMKNLQIIDQPADAGAFHLYLLLAAGQLL